MVESIAIHAAQDSETIITHVPATRLPEHVQECIASEGIYGAWRGDDGRVYVTDRTGEVIETTLTVSPDGYVFE